MKANDMIIKYVNSNSGKVWDLLNELKENKYTLEDAKECFGYMYAYFNEPKDSGAYLGVVTEPYYTQYDLMHTCYAILGIETSNGNTVTSSSTFNRRLSMICRGFHSLKNVLNVYLIDKYYYNYSYKLSLLPEEIREYWLGDHSISDIPGLYFFALEVVSYLLLTPEEGKKKYPLIELLQYIGEFTEYEMDNIRNLYIDLFNYSDNVVKYQDRDYLHYYANVCKKFEDNMELMNLGFDRSRYIDLYRLFNDLMDDLYKRHISKEKMYNKIIPIGIFRIGGIDETEN
jgi:hypothetical protein|nr:MAG TPA: hypothetical protein [Caudoviricetes sp.]